MKKIIIAIGLFVVLLIPLAGTRAASNFTITDFASDLSIQSDGQLRVVETIVVNFSEPSHGIYRDIPINYQKSDGTMHYTSLVVESVRNENGEIPYELIDNTNNLRIKIGDANVLVSGNQAYSITYSVKGVITSFDGYDELYWNVTGNGWPATIARTTAKLKLPSGAILQSKCYQGSAGSTEECTTSYLKQDATFSNNAPLSVGEGMTIVAGFTKGIVPILSVEGPRDVLDAQSGWYALFGFIVVMVLAFILLFRAWWLKGRDSYYERKSLHDPNQKEVTRPLFGSYEPIVPEYDSPEKLRPGELGILMDERADMVDISATIIDLAVRGYLTITEIPNEGLVGKVTAMFNKEDYTLTRTSKELSGLLPYEKKLIEGIFGSKNEVAISDLRDSFTSTLKEVKGLLYESVTNKELFYASPQKVRTKYVLIGVAFLVGAGIYVACFMFLLAFANDFFLHVLWLSFGIAIALIVSSFVIMIFSRAMPKRTAHGREIYRQALGYKLFVSGTEKYRQPFFERENIFMEVLPYAMIFGVTYKLANAMKEMGLQQVAPWYISNTAFNAATFVSNIDNFSNAFSSVTVSAPTSSGFSGGSSGGGFGGGGGGSW